MNEAFHSIDSPVARERPPFTTLSSTSEPITWPVPVPIWSGRDRLTLTLLTAIMLVPAVLVALASADRVTGSGSRLLVALPLVAVLGLVTVSPFTRDPSPRRLSVLPWTVWAGAAFVIMAASQALFLSVSPTQVPEPNASNPSATVEIFVVDFNSAMAPVAIILAAAIAGLGVLVGSVTRRCGRRWLVIAALGTVFIVPIWLVAQSFRDPALVIVFGPDWSSGAEIASAVAVVCLLPAPILALIAGAERWASRAPS